MLLQEDCASLKNEHVGGITHYRKVKEGVFACDCHTKHISVKDRGFS